MKSPHSQNLLEVGQKRIMISPLWLEVGEKGGCRMLEQRGIRPDHVGCWGNREEWRMGLSQKKKSKWCWIHLIPDSISDSPGGGGEWYKIASPDPWNFFCTAPFFRRTRCLSRRHQCWRAVVYLAPCTREGKESAEDQRCKQVEISWPFFLSATGKLSSKATLHFYHLCPNKSILTRNTLLWYNFLKALKQCILVKQVRIPVVFHEFTLDNRTGVNFFTFRWS